LISCLKRIPLEEDDELENIRGEYGKQFDPETAGLYPDREALSGPCRVTNERQ
jgi:hypothetical protein